jgi:hypothetical protein
MAGQLDYTAPSVRGPGECYEHAVAATVLESDTVDLPFVTLALWVGGTGDVAVIMKGGESVTFTAVQAGTLLKIRVTRLLSTGTSATAVVALG